MMRLAQGDLAGALDAYKESHAIRDKLAAADPGNAEWQRDLSVNWERLATVSERLGKTVDAAAAWRQALTMSEVLAERFPASVDLRTAPIAPLERALALLRPLAAAGQLDATRAGWVALLEGEFAELEP